MALLLLPILMYFTNPIIPDIVYAYRTSCEPALPSPKNAVIVEIPQYCAFEGSVTVSTVKQRPIYQYLGIPYAVPPVGALRFKPPIPLRNIGNGSLYDATKFKGRCPQLITDEDTEYLRMNSAIAEDCLYLNVFTLSSPEKNDTLMPVMIYIHGGGWYQNSAVEYCPNYLLDNDIILVTLQYRLGVLGFLNLDYEEVAGNMGLLDTLEALEWVHKYIGYFGGDNTRLTIAGQSSGGVSVSLMLVSPLVKPGLFHQAIVQSGNLFGSWVMDENSREHGLELARYVNCSQTYIPALVECLRNISSFELTKANFMYMNDRMVTTQNLLKEIGISHAVVQKVGGSKRFLIQQPKESMKSGNFLKVPLLTGVTKDEGSMLIEAFVDYILETAYKRLHYVKNINETTYLEDELFTDFMKCLGIGGDLRELEIFKEFYLPYETCRYFNSTVPGLVDLAGASVIKSITLNFARHMMKHAPTYLYTFDFKGRKTKLGYGRTPKHVYFDGVAHSDELLYLFPDPRNPSVNETELKIITHLTSLWSSFIINGNITISSPALPFWPKMSKFSGPYLRIEKELRIESNFLETYRSRYSTCNASSYKSVSLSLFIITVLVTVMLSILK